MYIYLLVVFLVRSGRIPPPPLFFVYRFEKHQNVENYAVTECGTVYRRGLIFQTSHGSFLNHPVQTGCAPNNPLSGG
jgi:hypothetical protein